MKLDRAPSNTSFYETFSDLMFATLVVFLLIVMVLVVQFRSSIDEILAPNRFVGGESGQAWFGLVRYQGEEHVVMVPGFVRNSIGVHTKDPKDAGDVHWRWAQYLGSVRGSDGVFLIPVDRWEEFRSSLRLRRPNVEQAGMDVIRAPYTAILPLQRYLDTYGDRPPTDRDPNRLYQLFGGYMGEALPHHMEEEFWNFYGNDTWCPRLNPLLYREPLAIAFGGGESYLRFRVNDRKIMLGDWRCEPRDLRCILRSISPSQDFYLEYVSEDSPGEAPPDWVVEEILRPVGWDRRVIADGYRTIGGTRSSESSDEESGS